MRMILISSFALLLAFSATTQAATFAIDPSHSTVGFSVRHMMISTVRGLFGEFSGTFTYAKGKPDTWRVEAEIQTASVSTNDERRDAHLRNPDFFDVENFPVMTFTSNKVEPHADAYRLHGDLTMLDVTKPVVLDLELTGEVTDPWGNLRVGFSARGKIDRKQWGMTWSQSLDAGGLVVGDEVTIELEIQGIMEG
jgi:polyisoprenoid-binding protein YceI